MRIPQPVPCRDSSSRLLLAINSSLQPQAIKSLLLLASLSPNSRQRHNNTSAPTPRSSPAIFRDNQTSSDVTHPPSQRARVLRFPRLHRSLHVSIHIAQHRTGVAAAAASVADMCFVFTCGEHTFRKQVEGYESITCQCHNCGNYAGHVIKSNPWFTFCFIPVLPLSFKGYQDVICNVCNFAQPLENRPDVQNMRGGGGQMPLQNQQYQGGGGGPPPGWGGGPPPQQQQGMRYG